MNPYIKSSGSTDIMSESGKKTPTVSPDQGATSATATIVPKELESAWSQFLKEREEYEDFCRCNKIIDKDLENSGWVESLEPTSTPKKKRKKKCGKPLS